MTVTTSSESEQIIYSTANWRKQLQANERKTYLVVAMFIAIYVFVGLLIDFYLHPELNKLSLFEELTLFAEFIVMPYATLIMGGVAIFSLFITYALHDRIMLFGTEYHEITETSTKKLIERQLYNVVEELRIAAGLRYMPKIYLINAEYMNAFASGYSEKSALVAITKGLLHKLDRDELQAVMAHELSHIRHHDIKLTLTASVLSNIMLIAIDLLFYSMLFSDRRRRNDENGDNRLFIVVVLMRYLLPLLTVILMLFLSRTREYMADAGAVELTRNNTPLARALIKISKDYEANQEEYAAAYNDVPQEGVRRASYIFDPTQAGISVQKTVAGLFSTHPPLKERLMALGVASLEVV